MEAVDSRRVPIVDLDRSRAKRLLSLGPMPNQAAIAPKLPPAMQRPGTIQSANGVFGLPTNSTMNNAACNRETEDKRDTVNQR